MAYEDLGRHRHHGHHHGGGGFRGGWGGGWGYPGGSELVVIESDRDRDRDKILAYIASLPEKERAKAFAKLFGGAKSGLAGVLVGDWQFSTDGLGAEQGLGRYAARGCCDGGTAPDDCCNPRSPRGYAQMMRNRSGMRGLGALTDPNFSLSAFLSPSATSGKVVLLGGAAAALYFFVLRKRKNPARRRRRSRRRR